MSAIIPGAAGVLRIINSSASLGRDRVGGLAVERRMGCTLGTEAGQLKVLWAPSQGRGSQGLPQSPGRRVQGAGDLAKPSQKMLAVQLLSGDATSRLNSFSFRGLFNISNKNKINNCTVYGNLRQK